ASSGADYVALSGHVIFPAGSATTTIVVAPVDDTLVEGTETVQVTLIAPPGYVVDRPRSATVNLIDNDAGTRAAGVEATARLAAEADEGPGVFTLHRSGDLSAPLTVNVHVAGTADSGSDYTGLTEGDSTVNCASGQGSVALTVTPVDDNEVEEIET